MEKDIPNKTPVFSTGPCCFNSSLCMQEQRCVDAASMNKTGTAVGLYCEHPDALEARKACIINDALEELALPVKLIRVE